jgi:hypothetical protein
MPEKFDIYSKIFCRDVENFFRYLCVLVLRHQMPVSNYFVNSFYSAPVDQYLKFKNRCSLLYTVTPRIQFNNSDLSSLQYFQFDMYSKPPFSVSLFCRYGLRVWQT